MLMGVRRDERAITEGLELAAVFRGRRNRPQQSLSGSRRVEQVGRARSTTIGGDGGASRGAEGKVMGCKVKCAVGGNQPSSSLDQGCEAVGWTELAKAGSTDFTRLSNKFAGS